MTMTETDSIAYKIQIFSTILTSGANIDPVQAAANAEKVFEKLCIPQAPNAQ